MLDFFFSVSHQILIMFLLVIVGILMYNFKIIGEQGTKELSDFLMKVIVPMIIISKFQRQFDLELFSQWSVMFGLSLLTFLVQLVLGWIAFRDKTYKNRPEGILSILLPNNGFLAFPLMQALAGEDGIFFGAASVVLLNIFQWTYGLKLMKPDEKLSIKKMILNPGTLSILIGLLLFISPVKLPEPVFAAVDLIGSLNTPIAMVILGCMIAQTDIKECFKNTAMYKISFLKLIVTPFLMILVLSILPVSDMVKLIVLITAAVPTATSVSMFSQVCDRDYLFATNAIMVSTILSVITMPLILTVGKMILGF